MSKKIEDVVREAITNLNSGHQKMQHVPFFQKMSQDDSFYWAVPLKCLIDSFI